MAPWLMFSPMAPGWLNKQCVDAFGLLGHFSASTYYQFVFTYLMLLLDCIHPLVVVSLVDRASDLTNSSCRVVSALLCFA